VFYRFKFRCFWSIEDQGVPMSNFSTEQVIPVSANPNQPPASVGGGFNPILIYGGVAVAVIIAMAYFSQIQLESITKLFKAMSKKTK
jgi:hypothetical protein